MVQHLREAFRYDVEIRKSTEQLPSAGAEIKVQEIEEGDVFDVGGLRVTAFAVDHGPVKPALGYRVDYSGHSVVISGDTKFSENLVKFARGTDCLIHSAWMVASRNPTPPSLRSIASAEDVARVFELTKPKLAVIYHYRSLEGVEEAIRARYGGRTVVAKDLMTIVIGGSITITRRNQE